MLFVDVDELSDDSLEPPASLSKPLVMPLGGRLDVHCRLPRGRPTPSQRFTRVCYVSRLSHPVYHVAQCVMKLFSSTDSTDNVLCRLCADNAVEERSSLS